MSWAELEREVELLSRFLARVPLELEPGDRLGVLGRNSAEYLKVSRHVWPLWNCSRSFFFVLYC